MHNPLLTAAIMLALTGASMASEQRQDARPQSNQTEQTEVAGNDVGGSMDADASISSDCAPKTSHQSKQKSAQDDLEGDPDAPQNQVEYGGGG
jgi:hypothetical protein